MASYGQPMQAPGGAWARVQLVRGSSGGQHWAIDANYPQARLTIGSAPDAGWPVQAPAVHPYHFEIFWDGQSLWVADTRRVGGVTLNGQPVGDWVQVRGQAQVAFGGGLMQVETSAAQAVAMASNPAIAKRVTLAPGEGALNMGAMVAQGAGGGPAWDDSSLPGEATRIAPPPSEAGGWKELDAESTRIAPEGAIALPPAPPSSQAPPPMMRPRLGGAGPAAAPDSRPMARTITADEMSQHLAVAMAGATPGDAASQGPSVVVQAGYPSVSGGAAPGFAPQQQAGAAAPFGAPQAPPGGQAAGPQSGFMAPPTFDQAAQPQGQKEGKGKQSLPMRTWGLLAITVLAAVGLMMMGPSEEEAPPAPQQQQAQAVPGQLPAQGAPGQPVPGQAVPGQVAPGQQAQPTATPVAGAVPSQAVPGQPTTVPATPVATAMPGQVDPSQPVPSDPGGTQVAAVPTPPPTPTPTPTPTPAAPGDPAAGPTPDRLAADLVITGHFAEALPHYQALAQAHPERPEYAQMVRILERRVRCQGGVGPDGRPCTP